MFQFSSSSRKINAPSCLAHAQLTALAGACLNLALALNASAQANSEVVITGNPLSKLESTNNVSSLSGLALTQQGQSTLGETLNNLPGVSSTYFGPNASRPIVRGLDGDRIRILSNSGAGLDVSALSYDHAVPMDVLSTERIEVLRGPASLQYGGSAIGGVVNVIDNRIPRKPLEGVLGKAQLQGATGNQEVSKAALLEVGQGVWVFHADAFDRRTGDVKVPHDLPCSQPGAAALAPRICNSASEARGGALGGSLFFDQGYVGLSLNNYQSHYGTVADDAVTIGMHSNRAALEGAWKVQSPWLQSVSFQVSQSDYKHTEFEAGTPGTLFANKGHDARIQVKHAKLRAGAGEWEGVWGWQSEQAKFSADGTEAFAPFSNTKSQSLFLIEDYKWGPFGLNLGVRREAVTVQSLGNPDPTVTRFEVGARQFSPQSLAVAGSYQLSPQWRVVGNVSNTERAPKDYELFANGPHIATASWERGNANLNLEKARSVDVSAQWQQGHHQFKVTGFESRFSNFIGLLSTHEVLDNLPVANYQGVRAKLSGFETSAQWRLIQASSTLDWLLKADAVRAQNLTTLEPLPRIAPFRVGSSWLFASGPWSASLGVDAYAAQHRVPVGSLPTDAYTLWHGHVNYKQKVGETTLNWFAKLDNATNQWAYSATSILTSTAPGKSPLPGRSLKLGVLATF